MSAAPAMTVYELVVAACGRSPFLLDSVVCIAHLAVCTTNGSSLRIVRIVSGVVFLSCDAALLAGEGASQRGGG